MKRKSYPALIGAILFLAATFAADSFFHLGLINKATSLVQPVGIVISDTGNSIANFFGNFRNIGKLQTENKDLKNKLDSALQEIAKLNEAQKENIALKNDLGYKNSSSFSLLPAEVVFFDPNNIRNTILLNVGSSQGVKEGQVVLSQGYLVGKISKVNPDSSKMILASDPLSAIPAAISSSTTTGIIKGQIGNGLTLEQVPQSDKVNQGDTVVTSGLGGEFPKGLIIGKIDVVQKISGSIFQQISVTPMVNLRGLERVMIIK